jgi:hypothetical protein
MRMLWQYQRRIELAAALAAAARHDPDELMLRPLAAVLRRHDAALTCQLDAFADDGTAAEPHGSTTRSTDGPRRPSTTP